MQSVDESVTKAQNHPSFRLRVFLFIYRLIWIVSFPLVVIYILWRGALDKTYASHFTERLGLANVGSTKEAIWIHAVSLGEVRTSVPLVSNLVSRGEKILLTCITAAGRREAIRLFRSEIDANQLEVRYLPFEYDYSYFLFLKRHEPKLLLLLEVEIWPILIMSARKAQVPVYLCNAHYSRERDKDRKGKRTIRDDLINCVNGVFTKSTDYADRFKSIGATNVYVTGELRFEMPVPGSDIKAAKALATANDLGFGSRPVVTISSSVKGEDQIFLKMIHRVQEVVSSAGIEKPLFVYVPRSPERFAVVSSLLKNAGLSIARRSNVLGNELTAHDDFRMSRIDVFVGDSIGEMPFYLELADLVVVGGGFHSKGSHNIIEPLAQHKPAIVGPNIKTIEYPALEAIEVDAVKKVESADELCSTICKLLTEDQATNLRMMSLAASGFFESRTGCASRIVAKLIQLKELDEV